jgi:hypothetical protein
LTSLERLIRTHPIWFLPNLTRDDATQLLDGKEHGVRRNKKEVVLVEPQSVFGRFVRSLIFLS